MLLANLRQAFNLCADMIRGNNKLQEGFAHFYVVSSPETSTQNGHASTNGTAKNPVIEALLNLVLNTSSNQLFDLRSTACECIKAYIHGHTHIRHHFLSHAINVHSSGSRDPANILTVLIEGTHGQQSADPYRTWFAAVLVFHLVYEDAEAKSMLMKVVEGDAESGEEVVTCIQILSGNLVASLQGNGDERASIGYLMLLCGCLFEDADAVNDFLGEGSTLQSLIQTASVVSRGNVLTRGLSAVLLGIIYEFSTKDSPISRRQLQPILTSKLGRDKYLSAIAELRQDPLVRDFEVLSEGLSQNAAGLPEVYFDATFIEFLKDNFSRLSRAIDRDPGIEVHQSVDGIDRDVLDRLRGELAEKNKAIQQLETDLTTMERRFNQEQANHEKTKQSSKLEENRIKSINESIRKHHDAELQEKDSAHRKIINDIESQHRRNVQQLQKDIQKAQTEGAATAEQAKRSLQDEITRLKQAHDEVSQKLNRATNESERAKEDRRKAVEGIKELQQIAKRSAEETIEVKRTIGNLQESLQTSERQIMQLKTEKKELEQSLDKLKHENEQLRSKSQDQIWAVKEAEEKVRKAEQTSHLKDEDIARIEKEKKAIQAELDDMLLVMADLEDKRSKDKVSHHFLFANVSLTSNITC
jgi:intracellular protein transport protein USO1